MPRPHVVGNRIVQTMRYISGFRTTTILAFSDKPDLGAVLAKMCHLLGYRLTQEITKETKATQLVDKDIAQKWSSPGRARRFASARGQTRSLTQWKTMWNRWDGLIVSVLATLAAIASFRTSQFIPFETWDVWFEGDLIRTYWNMVRADSDHSRTNLHPLVTYVTYRPTARLMEHFGAISAARILLAAVASVWVATFYLLLRGLQCRRLDSVLFSLLACISAAAMFWLPVPETYSFGSCTILLALLLILIIPEASFWGYVTLNALTLSMTVTNWMAGLLATIVTHSWVRSLQIIGVTLAVIVALSGIQKRGFPDAQYPFMKSGEEQEFFLRDDSGGPIRIVSSFFFHSIIMPDIVAVKNEQIFPGPKAANLTHKLSIQVSSVGSGSPWAQLAVPVWTALLLLGLWALFTVSQHNKFRLVLGLLLAGQLMLHLVYGEETFLYALHFAPLLVVTASLATLTVARPLVLLLVTMLIVTVGLNNAVQFQQAAGLVKCLQQRMLSETPPSCTSGPSKVSDAMSSANMLHTRSLSKG